MSKKIDRSIIEKIENILIKYPFWILRVETGGLGSPSIYNMASGQDYTVNSTVEDTAEYEEYIKQRITLIEKVYDLLPKDEKKLIQLRYFESIDVDDVMAEMNICKTKYYKLRKNTFYKFATAFGYIK
ncbi:DUF1492 domain-containing protein [Anaerophilus nitritogenes]|uniref:DUF1492 domain-containing protein n=1 Tax=Anaerophilus nitritogenes TaxID=2498136 RepID=UPI00101D95DE|nr:DUF1492 domain-containing protein [Anaerophilus nitritogenes]